MMAAYAEGFNIIKHANVGLRQHEVDAETTPLRDPEHYQLRDRRGAGRRSVAARQRGRLVAARPDRRRAAQEPDLDEFPRPRLRFRRGPLDAAGRDRRRRAGAGDQRGAVSRASTRAATRNSPTSCSRRCASRSAGTSRSRQEGAAYDGSRALRRDRLLRRDRRSGLQADLSLAAGAGARRRAERADHRRRQGRLEPGPAEGTRGRQPAASRRRRTRRRIAAADRPAALCRRRLQRPGDVRASCASSWARRSGRCTIWPCRPACSRTVAEAAGEVGLRRQCATGDREAVRPQPRNGAYAQPPAGAVLSRGEHLPHRPLPRQGAGAEHRLYALRQLDLRAAVEPRPRQQHPDHHGRGFRRAGSRPLLRRDRRDPRRGAEPPAAGAGAADHGSADRRGARGDARPEGRAAEGGAPARCRSTWCAGSTRATSRCPACARARPSRPSSRCKLLHRDLALGGRADLHPRRQAAAGDARPK